MKTKPTNLKPFTVADLKSLPTLRKLWLGTNGRDLDDETQDANRGLDTDLAYARTPSTRTFTNLFHVKKATDHIIRLPEPGETIHAVCSGRYPLWAIIPATLELAAPATIDHLQIVTLSFSKDNTDALLGMLDSEQIRRVEILVSHYFSHTNQYIYDPIAKALSARGQKIKAIRTHAKIINMAMSDGRKFTVESSANLRSCKNIEQLTLSQDKGLYDFHRGWIADVIEDEKKATEAIKKPKGKSETK